MSEQGVTVESAKKILAQKDAPKEVAKTPAKEVPAKPTAKAPTKSGNYAVLLIRGDLGMRSDVKLALETLRLRRKHVCAILPDNPVNRGLMQKVKDWVAFGPVSDATVKELQKKGSLQKDGKDLNLFRLHPPRGGFGRKGIKVSYNNGGVLGINPRMDDLLKRML